MSRTSVMEGDEIQVDVKYCGHLAAGRNGTETPLYLVVVYDCQSRCVLAAKFFDHVDDCAACETIMEARSHDGFSRIHVDGSWIFATCWFQHQMSLMGISVDHRRGSLGLERFMRAKVDPILHRIWEQNPSSVDEAGRIWNAVAKGVCA